MQQNNDNYTTEGASKLIVQYYYPQRNPDVRCVTVSQDKGPINQRYGYAMQSMHFISCQQSCFFFDNDDLDSYTGQHAIMLR